MFKILIKRTFCQKTGNKFDEVLQKLNIKLPKSSKANIEQDQEMKAVDFKFFNNKNDFINFFKKNKEYLLNKPDLYFLFMDNLSNVLYDSNEETATFSDDISELVSLYIDKLGYVEPLFFISFIESLNKLDYYTDNKVWISIESIISKSNIINNIDIRLYYIILKGFQRFFNIKDTTISAEEIFEIIEYNIKIKLKEVKALIFKTKDDLKILDLFTLFAYNLEGSVELYNLFIDKILRPNLTIIKRLNPTYIVNIYSSLVIINKNKLANVESFINEMDEIVKDLKLESGSLESDLFNWSLKYIKLNFNKNIYSSSLLP
jgi:hypothetical protein